MSEQCWACDGDNKNVIYDPIERVELYCGAPVELIVDRRKWSYMHQECGEILDRDWFGNWEAFSSEITFRLGEAVMYAQDSSSVLTFKHAADRVVDELHIEAKKGLRNRLFGETHTTDCDCYE